MGYPSSLAVCADSPRSGAPLREGGGGRNLHRRQGNWTFGRPCQREEDPDVYRDRDPGAEGIGRCRMAPVADASSELLHSFVLDNVEPGATVITDAWQGYRWLEKHGYIHDRRSQRAASTRGEDPGELLPGVHRIASLAKRWLLGTHQGAVDSAHLPSYLDEFAFRFNRRRSRSRGMLFYRVLELAVAHGPVRYQDLVMSQSPKAVPPKPPRHRGHPPSLERPSPNRPWRQIVQSG